MGDHKSNSSALYHPWFLYTFHKRFDPVEFLNALNIVANSNVACFSGQDHFLIESCSGMMVRLSSHLLQESSNSTYSFKQRLEWCRSMDVEKISLKYWGGIVRVVSTQATKQAIIEKISILKKHLTFYKQHVTIFEEWLCRAKQTTHDFVFLFELVQKANGMDLLTHLEEKNNVQTLKPIVFELFSNIKHYILYCAKQYQNNSMCFFNLDWKLYNFLVHQNCGKESIKVFLTDICPNKHHAPLLRNFSPAFLTLLSRVKVQDADDEILVQLSLGFTLVAILNSSVDLHRYHADHSAHLKCDTQCLGIHNECLLYNLFNEYEQLLYPFYRKSSYDSITKYLHNLMTQLTFVKLQDVGARCLLDHVFHYTVRMTRTSETEPLLIQYLYTKSTSNTALQIQWFSQVMLSYFRCTFCSYVPSFLLLFLQEDYLAQINKPFLTCTIPSVGKKKGKKNTKALQGVLQLEISKLRACKQFTEKRYQKSA